MSKRILFFLIINFSALAIGTFFTGDGATSEWYQNLNKAPWTPPGWVFGTAWTTIMICFSVYMAFLIEKVNQRKTIWLLFSSQYILNILWNPCFFYFHEVLLGLIDILFLFIIVGCLLFMFLKELKLKSIFIAPYFIWLAIATSLNAYILLMN